jgi:hypothetical protein
MLTPTKIHQMVCSLQARGSTAWQEVCTPVCATTSKSCTCWIQCFSHFLACVKRSACSGTPGACNRHNRHHQHSNLTEFSVVATCPRRKLGDLHDVLAQKFGVSHPVLLLPCDSSASGGPAATVTFNGPLSRKLQENCCPSHFCAVSHVLAGVIVSCEALDAVQIPVEGRILLVCCSAFQLCCSTASWLGQHLRRTLV